MSIPDYAKFKAVTNINRPLISNNLAYGLVDFYNFALLNAGAYTNIVRNTSGVYGGDRCRLSKVDDKRFTDGTVWEGFRGNWVWESGIDFTPQPFRPSGIWLNNTFYTENDATYEHYFDYPRGRVIFTNPLPTRSVVQTEFSARTVFFVDTESEYLQKLMYDSWDVSRTDWLTSSGMWTDWADTRLQLPVVGVCVVDNMRFEPFQLGGGQWCNIDVIFYIFAEDQYTKRQLADTIAAQNNKTIWIPNYALVKSNQATSLDYRGNPVPSAVQFNDLVTNSTYQWRKVQFQKTEIQENRSVHQNLHKAVVKTTVNMIMENL